MAYKDLTFLLFAKDMSASRGFEKVAASGDAMAAGLKGSMGIAALAVAGLAIDLGAKSVKMAADFQTATTRLVTDAGESQKGLGKVSKGLLDMSVATGTSATELAKGMYYVESAGYHGANGLTVMKAAAEGAKVGGANLTTVADALTTVMKDYHTPVDKANNITSELIATVSHGKTTMEDLAGSLHSVLPNAQALHIPLKDILGALATMTQEGIGADQATQNLNHTIVSLASPTHVQTQAMAAMGLNSTTVAKQLGKKGLTGTMNELVSAIDKHIKGGSVLQASFTHSALAAKSANAEYNSLTGRTKVLAGAYKTGQISLKDWNTDVKGLPANQANLAKQWKTTEDASKGFSQALKSGSGPAKTFVAQLEQMTGGQTGLQVALHITGVHAKDTTDNVKKIGDAAKGTQKNVSDWDKTQGTFNQKMAVAGAAVSKWGIEIGEKLLPVLGGIASAVPGVIDWLVKMNTSANDFLKGLLSLGGQALTAGINIVKGLVQGVMDQWGNAISAIGNLGGNLISAFNKAVGNASPSKKFKQYGKWIVQGLNQGLLGSTSQVSAAAQTLATAVRSAFSDKQISKSVEQSTLADIKSATDANSTLAKLASQRTALQSKLSSLESDRTGVHDTTKAATTAAGDVTSFAGPGDAVLGLQSLVTNTKTFTTDLQALTRKGVSGALLAQLVDGWNSDPATALSTAQGLLANPTDLKQIISLSNQLGTAGGALGALAGHSEYDSQVNAASGKIKVTTWEMQKAAAAALKKEAKELHIHLNLNGTYAGTKDDLAKTIKTVIQDAVKKGTIPKNWATA